MICGYGVILISDDIGGILWEKIIVVSRRKLEK